MSRDHEEPPPPALPRGMRSFPVHDYVSTACQHRLHGNCRNTCKYCQTPCLCVCHRWVIPVEAMP